MCLCCFFFKQKTAYEMRISDWSSDVCSSDLAKTKHKTQNSSSINQTTVSSIVFFAVDDEYKDKMLQLACGGQKTDSFAIKPHKEFDRSTFVKVISSKDEKGEPVYVFEAELKGMYQEIGRAHV